MFKIYIRIILMIFFCYRKVIEKQESGILSYISYIYERQKIFYKYLNVLWCDKINNKNVNLLMLIRR